MTEPESSDRLIEVLKEIRDELRAVRVELGARTGRTTSGIRTERMNRDRWRNPALAAGGVAALALVIGLSLRDRPTPEPAKVAVGPQIAEPVAAQSPSPVSTPRAVASAPAPAVAPAPVAAHAAAPVARPPAAATPAPGTKEADRFSAAAEAPVPAKKRLRAELATRPPVEAVSDDDAPIAFSPAPRRIRVHRLSYGPVGSEPAKL